MLRLDCFGVDSRTSKTVLKGTERLWHNPLIWIKFRCVSLGCQSFITYALFSLKDCSGQGQASFWPHLTKPIFHSYKLAYCHPPPFTSPCRLMSEGSGFYCVSTVHTMADREKIYDNC